MTTLPFLLAVALKGALVLLLAALAAALLRAAPASARHGVWAAAFGALLLLPVLESVGPRWAVGVLPPTAPSAVHVGGPALSVPAPAPPPAPPSPPAPPFVPDGRAGQAELAAFEADAARRQAELIAFEREVAAFEHDVEAFHAETAALFDGAETSSAIVVGGPGARGGHAPAWGPWALALWGLGALAVGLGWLAATLAAHRLVATARPEADDEWAVLAERARRLSGLGAPVRLLWSDRLEVPIAWGLGRPAVVLPASADAWDEDRREAVLLHEMAHLRRRDAWTQALAQLAVALHWANPLAWLAYRRFLAAREQACDDAVLRGGARPSAYAAHLVGVARALGRDRFSLAGAAPMARKAPLEGRVASILDGTRRRGRLSRPALGGTLVAAALVVGPLAALRPVAAEAGPSEASAVAAAWTAPDGVEPAAPAVPPRPPVALSDTTDEPLDRALREAERVLAEYALDTLRVRAEVARVDLEVDRLRAEALREAERALAEVDLDALRAEAAARVLADVARLSRNDPAVDLRDIHVDLEELRRQLRESEREVRQSRETAARAQSDARHRADEALDALRLREAERRRAPQPPRPDPRPDSRPTPDPAPRPDAAPSAGPSAPPALHARFAKPFDWTAVDRARHAANARYGVR